MERTPSAAGPVTTRIGDERERAIPPRTASDDVVLADALQTFGSFDPGSPRIGELWTALHRQNIPIDAQNHPAIRDIYRRLFMSGGEPVAQNPATLAQLSHEALLRLWSALDPKTVSSLLGSSVRQTRKPDANLCKCLAAASEILLKPERHEELASRYFSAIHLLCENALGFAYFAKIIDNLAKSQQGTVEKRRELALEIMPALCRAIASLPNDPKYLNGLLFKKMADDIFSVFSSCKLIFNVDQRWEDELRVFERFRWAFCEDVLPHLPAAVSLSLIARDQFVLVDAHDVALLMSRLLMEIEDYHSGSTFDAFRSLLTCYAKRANNEEGANFVASAYHKMSPRAKYYFKAFGKVREHQWFEAARQRLPLNIQQTLQTDQSALVSLFKEEKERSRANGAKSRSFNQNIATTWLRNTYIAAKEVTNPDKVCSVLGIFEHGSRQAVEAIFNELPIDELRNLRTYVPTGTMNADLMGARLDKEFLE